MYNKIINTLEHVHMFLYKLLIIRARNQNPTHKNKINQQHHFSLVHNTVTLYGTWNTCMSLPKGHQGSCCSGLSGWGNGNTNVTLLLKIKRKNAKLFNEMGKDISWDDVIIHD